MTRQELRETKDYKEAVDKIKGYTAGFEFTLDYTKIPIAKGNALKIIIQDMVDAGILESISFGLDLDGSVTDESYRRTEKA